MEDGAAWKTEEYHAHDMHVRTSKRVVEDAALPGHGDQWDFTVKVTARGAGLDAADAEVGRSDPDVFYSTQPIAENMGFLKGREMIEGRNVGRANDGEENSRAL